MQKQVTTFMTEERFKKTLPDVCLLQSIEYCITEYIDRVKEDWQVDFLIKDKFCLWFWA